MKIWDKIFLTRLQTGDILEYNYIKVLIDMFVNSIYLYDYNLIIICNVGNKPITLTNDLIEDIKGELVTDQFTFVKRFGSPQRCIFLLSNILCKFIKKYWQNLINKLQ